MGFTIQKVAFSERRGVFLGCKDGKPVWSKDGGLTGKELAPVFQDRQDLAAFLNKEVKVPLTGEQEREFVAAELREIFPRQDRDGASVEEVANAGMPRWD